MKNSFSSAFASGAVKALEARKASRHQDYKRRNSETLLAGKTPSEERNHLLNQSHYEEAIRELRQLGEEA